LLNLENFNDVAQLVARRRSLLDFIDDCRGAEDVQISVPRKSSSSLSLLGRAAVVTDPDSVVIILEIAEGDARRQLKEVEEKILRLGLELPC
jgi:hypothetical protein